MYISDYKINKFDPNSCDELITEVDFKHYGFKCHGKLYTCNGELDNNYIVTAKVKFIGVYEKGDTVYTVRNYDSTVKEINEDTIAEVIDFNQKLLYQRYKNN